VHNRGTPYDCPSYIRVRAVVCQCGDGQTRRQTHRRAWPTYISHRPRLTRNVMQLVKVIWQKAALPPHTDGSVVFARLRQCAPHLIHFSLTSQIASPSVKPFLHSSREKVPILYNGPPLFPFKIAHLQWGSGHPSNTWFSGPPNSTTQTVSRSVQPFLQAWQTDGQTVHATPSITIGRIYVVLRCGLTITKNNNN